MIYIEPLCGEIMVDMITPGHQVEGRIVSGICIEADGNQKEALSICHA